MIELQKSLDVKKFFFFILVFLIATDLAILLNIPFLRQTLGFLFLTILPGLLILQILKLNKIGFTEKFVLSVGLSISFLMFFGLLINNLSLSIGYEKPLATISLLISFNIAIIALAIISHRIKKETIFSLPDLNLTTSEKAFLIVPILFPALSIFGMYVMNTTDNNILLMSLLFLIPIYVVLVCFFNHKFSKRLYPIVIFLISISLLLLLALRSNHVIGADTHQEYYFFQTTLDNLHWCAFGHSTLDACLAISLLPTIYQSILNIDPEFLFKILYSLLFSISPLVVYVLSKKYVGDFYEFLTSCFFMAQFNFLMTEVHARTNTAILFFALAMMVLFNDKIDPLKKRVLFIVFMASCMVSHYSTTYIFFFVMIGTFVGVEILSKKYIVKKVVSLTIMILFFALIFFWYSQVTEASFYSGVIFVKETFRSLNEFFVVEASGLTTQAMLGEGIGQKGIPHKIEFMLTWLMLALIGIGILTLIRRYKEMSFPELNFKKLAFLKEKFEVTYFVIVLVLSGLLVATLAIPFITAGYSLERQYTLAMVVLSVFFVIGGITLSKNLSLGKKALPKKQKERKNISQQTFKGHFASKSGGKGSDNRAYLIILLVLIPYFFCTTGVMYQVFGIPRAITLNSEGKTYDLMYIHDQDSSGAKWLMNYGERKIKLYTDRFGMYKLVSQGKFLLRSIDWSSFPEHREIEGYIYLYYNNIVNGEVYKQWDIMFNISDYADMFVGKNKIYANGGSEVYE